jgi:hypothetical protein
MQSLLARTEEEGDCHIWTGYYGNGVPMVHHNDKMVSVRKVIFELLGKPVRQGFYSTTCGHKGCVCPDHIAYRAPKAHMKAMIEREFSRERVLKMTQARRKRADVVLSEAIAREIRQLDGTYRDIGAQYGVTKSVVSRIKRGEYWAESASPWAGLMR